MERDKAKHQKKNKMKKHHIGFLGFLVFAFVAVVLTNLMLSYDSRVETTIVRHGEEEDAIVGEGYIFSEQTVIEAPTDGYIYCEASEDERVSVGEPVVYIYKNQVNITANSELKAIDDKIKELSEGLRTAEVFSSDTAKIEKTIAENIRSVSKAAAKNDMKTVSDIGAVVNELIEKRRVASGEIQPADRSAELDALKKKKAELEQKYNIERTIVHTPKTGAFTARIDGLEERLSPAMLENINLAYIKELDKINKQPEMIEKVAAGEPVGKIVNNFAWYLAVPVEKADIEGVSIGDVLKLRFPDVGIETIEGKVSRITAEESGKVILIIDSNKYIDSIYSSSKVKVELVRHSYQGFRIPEKSLRMIDGIMGVYVIRSNKARFVPVELLYNAGSWVVVKELVQSAQNPKVLKLYDELIISGKDIFEGKVMR